MSCVKSVTQRCDDCAEIDCTAELSYRSLSPSRFISFLLLFTFSGRYSVLRKRMYAARKNNNLRGGAFHPIFIRLCR